MSNACSSWGFLSCEVVFSCGDVLKGASFSGCRNVGHFWL